MTIFDQVRAAREFTEADLPELPQSPAHNNRMCIGGFNPTEVRAYALAAVAAYRKKLMGQEPVCFVGKGELDRLRNEVPKTGVMLAAGCFRASYTLPLYAAPMPQANEAHPTPMIDDACGVRGKDLSAPEQSEQAQAIDGQHPVFAFLLGESALRGVYFGDRHPDKRGTNWWRKDLREALAQEQASGKAAPSEDEIEQFARDYISRDIDWSMPENLGATAVQRAYFRAGFKKALELK